MTFDEVLAQVQELLQRQQRVSYRGLRRRFDLDDEFLEDLKEELIGAKRVATDEEGRFLVWSGEAAPVPAPSAMPARTAEAERRHLTVEFIDLVGSTSLSQQLDPEDLHPVMQAYRETCATVIRRFEGYLAKYVGDGLLVYFGYPQAHEDDAQRAVQAGLGIIAELPQLNARFQSTLGAGDRAQLQVRIGIHTGLVVAGEMGVSDQPEPMGIVGENSQHCRPPARECRPRQRRPQPDHLPARQRSVRMRGAGAANAKGSRRPDRGLSGRAGERRAEPL